MAFTYIFKRVEKKYMLTREQYEYLVEAIAPYMEIDRYGETVGIARFDTSPIEESMDYLMKGLVPFEFRTTLVRGLHTEDSLRTMGQRLAGQEAFYLQAFVDSGDLIQNDMEGFTPEETRSLLSALRENVPNAQIRGY